MKCKCIIAADAKRPRQRFFRPLQDFDALKFLFRNNFGSVKNSEFKQLPRDRLQKNYVLACSQ